MPNHFTEMLTCPFGELATNLSDSELRETAYEILVGACRSSGVKPLTFISHSEKNSGRASAALNSTASLQRSLSLTGDSNVKKALGLKPSRRRQVSGESDSERVKKAVTIGEMLRVQLRVSEQIDSRVRRALLRIAAAQVCSKKRKELCGCLFFLLISFTKATAFYFCRLLYFVFIYFLKLNGKGKKELFNATEIFCVKLN